MEQKSPSAGIVEEKDDLQMEEKSPSVEKNDEKNNDDIQMEVVMFDTPPITTIKPDESGYVNTSTTSSFGAIMDEVDHKETQQTEEVEEQTEEVDTTSGDAIREGLKQLYNLDAVEEQTEEETESEEQSNDTKASERQQQQASSLVNRVKKGERPKRKTYKLQSQTPPKRKRAQRKGGKGKEKKQEEQREIIDLDNHIDVTPPEPKKLKKPQKLKLWKSCSENEEKLIQPFFENATECDKAYSFYFCNLDLEVIINGKHIQCPMDNQNIHGEIIDYYINMLKSKMKSPHKPE